MDFFSPIAAIHLDHWQGKAHIGRDMATADLDALDILLNEAFGPLAAGREDFAPVPGDAWFQAMRDEADRMALAEVSTPAQMAGTVAVRRLPPCEGVKARLWAL